MTDARIEERALVIEGFYQSFMCFFSSFCGWKLVTLTRSLYDDVQQVVPCLAASGPNGPGEGPSCGHLNPRASKGYPGRYIVTQTFQNP